MKAIYWQKGESKDHVNTGSTMIEAGTVIALKNRIGIAGTNIAPNEKGSIHVTGVFELQKAAGVTIEDGETLYYDPVESVVTKVAGDIKAGYAFESKTDTSSTILVKID